MRIACSVVVAAASTALALLVGGGTGGCTAPEGPRTPDSRYLSQKVPAIKQAVERKDHSVAAQLVKDLDSDDPAVRFYAIEGLERLTGETFGYHYYEDRDARSQAVQKWRQWLGERGPATDQQQ